MESRLTTLRCTRDQIRHLLEMGLREEDEFESNQDEQEFSSGAGRLGLEGTLAEMQGRVPVNDRSMLSGDRLWRDALDPGTSLEQLTGIKEAAKLLHEMAADDRERVASTALYYLAVAAACVRRKVLISSMPPHELKRSFETIATESGKEAAELFRMAAAWMESKDSGNAAK